MRNVQRWFSKAVMAALVRSLVGLCLFTSANGMPQSGGPTLSISDVSVNEGNSDTTDILVAVTLTNPNSQTVSVDYQVVDGTATAGSDYTVISASGTITFFNGGATTQRIRVTINGDTASEPNETFFVNLSNAANATLADNQATGTIINDDGGGSGPALSISDVSINEGNAGTTDVLVAVTLANPDGQTVSVDYQVVDGTATAGSDYTVISAFGTMTFFNGGATTQRIRLTINGDATKEPDETVLVNLSNVTNATLVNNQGAATIINDDELSAPGNLSATAGISAAALAWADNSSDEDGFKIERTFGGGSFSEIAAVGSNVNWFNDTGVSGDILYTYRVRAYKGILNSGYSNEASLIISIEPPNVPTNLSATATGASTVALAWADNSSDENGFKIERKISGGVFSEIISVGHNVTSFNDAGLSAGTTYVYRVRAFKAALNSSYTDEATVTTLPVSTANLALNKPIAASSTYAPRPVTNAVDGSTNTYWRSGSVKPPAWLRVDLGAAMVVGRVVVKWRENYYAKNYEAQVSNDGVNWTTVATATGSAGAQTLSFSPRTARYVRLNFLVNRKSNYRIEEFEVYSGAAAKSHEPAAAAASLPQEFVLEQNYPNPFSANDNLSTRISFNLPQAEHVTIKVFALSGAEVNTIVAAQYPPGKHTVVYRPKNLPSGTYFYVMQAGEVRRVRQLTLLK